MTQLVGRRPTVAPDQLIASLVPPPHFAHVSLSNYEPNPEYPSQAVALATVKAFAKGARRSTRLRPSGTSSAGRGLYLDGGFGVGKTHLLAALAHELGADARYGTFVEYTNLVGALGFHQARTALQEFRLVCIDEFELDDPGDTLLVARLMRELTDAGVAVAATSNTLPESLGEGRFAAEDFRREIQGLAAVFTVTSIDGPDYRHRGELAFHTWSDAAVDAVAEREGGAVEQWDALVADLAFVHPSRMGPYVAGVHELGLHAVTPLTDQGAALRVVTLVDRLYDRDVKVLASGGSLGDIFPPEMLRGGYRKKYFRALSRLAAMSEPAA